MLRRRLGRPCAHARLATVVTGAGVGGPADLHAVSRGRDHQGGRAERREHPPRPRRRGRGRAGPPRPAPRWAPGPLRMPCRGALGEFRNAAVSGCRCGRLGRNHSSSGCRCGRLGRNHSSGGRRRSTRSATTGWSRRRSPATPVRLSSCRLRAPRCAANGPASERIMLRAAHPRRRAFPRALGAPARVTARGRARRVQRNVDEPQVAVVRNMDPPPPRAADQVPAAAAGARPHARSSFAAGTKPPARADEPCCPRARAAAGEAADAVRGRGAFRLWRRTASSKGSRSRCCSPLATPRDQVRPGPPSASSRRICVAPAWGHASVTKTTIMEIRNNSRVPPG
jgi:hypothetical protein